MEKRTVRAGIVGSGFAARFHFEAVQRVYGANVEVVGVFSRRPEPRNAFADERGINAFDNLDELLDSIDVVHVCVPPAVHAPVAIAALERDKYAIVEKPFTGYFGDGSEDFHADSVPKEKMLEEALATVRRMLDAEKKSNGRILYAENWVYAPAIQKEREIIEKTGAQILWMHGEEAHSGSHAYYYGFWKSGGGGAMIGKGCHPLTGALYLKRVEGRARNGVPIRPAAVTARTHSLTRLDGFQDRGHLRTEYHDIEDFSLIHVVFDDGTIADVYASEIVLGGIHNWLEIAANNHRSICNINPNTAMQTYNPVDEYFKDIYVVEKTETKQGWASTSPDEDWFTGYYHEMEAFYRAVAYGDPIESDSSLAADCISTIYSGYLSAERAGAEVPVTVL